MGEIRANGCVAPPMSWMRSGVATDSTSASARRRSAVASAMVELVPRGTGLLGGLEMGGSPIATVLSSQTSLPALFVRKKAKEYGTCKLAEGPDVAGARAAGRAQGEALYAVG